METQHSNTKRRLSATFGGVIVVVVLVIAGGIYWHRNSKVSCENFSELSTYVFETIPSPDSKTVMEMNPSVITSFRWQRSASEPFITYPIISGVQATYRNSSIPVIEDASKLIRQSIDEKVKKLGLSIDPLNTLPFQIFSNGDTLQVFAFKKGSDIYKVTLESEGGHQALGQSAITVACGRTLPDYDKIYGALNLKTAPLVENPHDNDYVAIADVSSDGKVYGLIGSTNQINIARYYYFDNDSLKLVSADSYPTQCTPLESLKIGRGMRCVDSSHLQRTVNY